MTLLIITLISIALIISAIAYISILRAPTWATPYYSIHVSQVESSCDSFGYGCLEKFIEHFNSVEWEIDTKHKQSLFGKGFDTRNKIHAAIIEFDNKGMILNRRDFRRAGKIINAKLKELHKKTPTVEWGCAK